MKKLSILLLLALVLCLSFGAASYAAESLNIEDNSIQYRQYSQAFGQVYRLDDPTDTAIPFDYAVPANGATVVIFFGASSTNDPNGCANSTSLIEDISKTQWAQSENVSIVAVEISLATKTETEAFIKAHDKGNVIDQVYYNPNSNSIAFWYAKYVELEGSMSGVYDVSGVGMSAAYVLIVTGDENGKYIRYSEQGVKTAQVLTNALSVLINISDPTADIIEITVPGAMRYDQVNAVVSATNEFRRDNGKTNLTLSGQLTQLAMQRAAECAIIFNEEHTRPNGYGALTIDEEGLYSSGHVGAENMAVGLTSASGAVNAWINSARHRANMLSDDHTQIGVGCFENNGVIYWVQLFGYGSDTTSIGYSNSRAVDVKVKALESMLNLSLSSDTPLSLEVGQSVELPLLYHKNAGSIDETAILRSEVDSVKDESNKIIALSSYGDPGTGIVKMTGCSAGSGTILIKVGENLDTAFVFPLNVSGYGQYYGYCTFTSEFKTGGMTYPYYYDESWFFNSSLPYNHDLTKMSIRVALTAYGKGRNSTADNIVDLMEDLDYKNIEPSYPKPTVDTIGYIIGRKNITNEDGEKITLVMVAVRGGDYKEEWGSNFDIGIGKRHSGFNNAASEVLIGLGEYLQKHSADFESTVKFWITGYSRGAAVANLTAATLTESKGAENVFAICFECPAVTRADIDNVNYVNIKNIINPIDVVTMVAPRGWGYKRYGVDLFLPSRENTYSYSAYYSELVNNYQKIFEENGIDDAAHRAYLYTQNKWQQEYLLTKLVYLVAELFENPQYLTYHYGPAVVELGRTTLGKGEWDDDTAFKFLDGIMNLLGWRIDIVDFTEYNCIMKIAKKEYIKIRSTEIITDAAILFLDGPLIYDNLTSYPSAMRAHFGELCMAWLDSLEGELGFSKERKREVFVNCPVDIAVYDSNGVLVAEIIDNEVVEHPDGIVAYIDENEQKVLILPGDEEFEVVLNATDDGTVTYAVTECSLDTMQVEKVVSYFEINVEEGDELIGTVEDLVETADADYPLVLNEEPLAATIDADGDDIQEYTVTVECIGNGIAYGGGSFIGGEFSKVIAEPEEGEEFLGWYIGDELVSEETEYRFLVDRDVAISAKFTSITTPDVTLKSANLTLGGEIGLNFKLDIPDEVAGAEGAKAVITYKGESAEIPLSSVTPNNQGLYVFTKGVPAKEIANPIRIKVVDSSGKAYDLIKSSGAACENNEFSYSVTDYCTAAVNVISDAKLKALMQALQNYGHYAHALFGSADAEPALATEVDMSGITADSLSQFAVKQTGSVSGLKLTSMFLTLESETDVNLRFELASGAKIGDYKFTCAGKTLPPVKSGDTYVVKLPNIAAKDLDTVYTVTVKKGSKTLTVKCSALTYSYLVLKGSTDTKLCDAMKALKLYNDAANDYFGK